MALLFLLIAVVLCTVVQSQPADGPGDGGDVSKKELLQLEGKGDQADIKGKVKGMAAIIWAR